MSRQDSAKNRVMTGICEPVECRGRRAVRTEVAPTPEMFHEPAVMRERSMGNNNGLRQILNAQHFKVGSNETSCCTDMSGLPVTRQESGGSCRRPPSQRRQQSHRGRERCSSWLETPFFQ